LSKLYIFDADGTLRGCNVPGQPCPNKPEQSYILPNVKETLAKIDWSQNGFGIASNQGGIALGYLSERDAYQMLANLTVDLLDRWPRQGVLQICPHAPTDGCGCRKPKPLMLQRIMNIYGVYPDDTLFVGDMESDRLAALAAGCRFQWANDFFGQKGRLF
jgi:D-glycero-D-manno-heptose 1,7-bisphosphate phosphatase